MHIILVDLVGIAKKKALDHSQLGIFYSEDL
jgi:hypothetical protein